MRVWNRFFRVCDEMKLIDGGVAAVSRRVSVAALIARAPFGVMPPWSARLGEDGVRAVATYVHQLGGGE